MKSWIWIFFHSFRTLEKKTLLVKISVNIENSTIPKNAYIKPWKFLVRIYVSLDRVKLFLIKGKQNEYTAHAQPDLENRMNHIVREKNFRGKKLVKLMMKITKDMSYHVRNKIFFWLIKWFIFKLYYFQNLSYGFKKYVFP